MDNTTGKLGRFRQLPAADQWLVIRAAFWLGIARAMLVFIPFSRLIEWMSAPAQATPVAPDRSYLERAGYAVRAAAGSVPWRADCFPQAVAARMLLRRKGYATTIHLGVEKAQGGNIAGHAWLTCDDYVVTGAGELDRYTEMHRINA